MNIDLDTDQQFILEYLIETIGIAVISVTMGGLATYQWFLGNAIGAVDPIVTILLFILACILGFVGLFHAKKILILQEDPVSRPE